MSDAMPPDALTCDDVRELAGAFVLDALTPDEAAAVRAHLSTCPDAHAEIAELASALPILDATVPVVEPPADLKGRVLAAAAADLVASTVVAAPPAPIPFPAATSATPTAAKSDVTSATQTRGTSRATWVLRIAAVLVIGVLAGWNLLLQAQLGSAERYQQDVATVIGVAGQPGSLTALLTAEGDGGPAGIAAVSATGDVSLAMHDLDPTSGAEVYEAWVIGSDGVPVPLGSFLVGSAGTAFFEGGGLPAEAGIVLAVTREPGQGATSPTLPIVSSGTASTPG